jgi:hypothetical protein
MKIGMQRFSSYIDADAWMKLNCPLTGSYSYFLDFHSLMALAHGAGGTMGEILKVEEARAKLNFTTHYARGGHANDLFPHGDSCFLWQGFGPSHHHVL